MSINYKPLCGESGTRLMLNKLTTTLSADAFSTDTELFLASSTELATGPEYIVIIYDGTHIEQIPMVSHGGVSTIIAEGLLYDYVTGSTVIIGEVSTGD